MQYEDRLSCVELARQGKTDAEIAQSTGWSVWAVRKWRRRNQKQGEQGLVSRMGRPKRGAMSSYPERLGEEIERMGRLHPGWGPITLLAELALEPSQPFPRLPSRARVAAFLKEKQLVRVYQTKPSFPLPAPCAVQQAHAEWELDAQGKQDLDGLEGVQVVNIIDLFSQLKVASYPHTGSTYLGWRDYQFILRCAFTEYGLPDSISLDHDISFFEHTCASPFPSRLHLWLIGLGIEVRFIRKPPPMEHAHIERMHQTMRAQGVTVQPFQRQIELWQHLEQRRNFLNLFYPSRSLHHQAPLQACPQAAHSARAYRPEWEAELFDVQRLYAFLAQGHWSRGTTRWGEICLGLFRYNAGHTWARTTVEVTFDPATQEMVAQQVSTGLTRRFPALGLTYQFLTDDLLAYARMPAYQFSLPFTRDYWRKNENVQLMTGTTF
jgi:hypothetical protein